MGDHSAPSDRHPIYGLVSYRKVLVGLIFALLSTASTTLGGSPTEVEWCQVVAQASVLIPVYLADNRSSRYAKSICAAVGAALSVLIPLLLEGGSLLELPFGVYVNAGLAAAGALGVYQVPNLDAESGRNLTDV